MITTTYDPEADALYITLMPRGTVVAETREVAPGVMHDLDAEGRLVGIEILGVRARNGAPVAEAA
ncbi:DUF2283 domain-containing protein [Roseomonas sp. BN140053]|uniref:DUF2283 domain-containing protein n=1 Tax=Roseomonas sp. BN140053 TaxID=3391898 RepID=UPI0039E9A124